MKWVPIPVLHEESRSDLQCLWLGIVGSSWGGLSREAQRAVGKEASEVVPLVVEQDAAQVQDAFGSVTTPAHSRAIQAHSDQIADSAFDDARSDWLKAAPNSTLGAGFTAHTGR
jgi:hypothetical protein